MVKVGINGFGRIGATSCAPPWAPRTSTSLRSTTLTNAATLAHLLKYDSVLGNLHADVKASGEGISVDGEEFKVLSVKDPAQLPWKDLGVDVVFESTGLFTNRDAAAKHFGSRREEGRHHARRQRVRIFTVVLGVNDDKYDPAKHHIISNASCTTNCLAPLAKVIHERFGIRKGWMTTVHSYTQRSEPAGPAAQGSAACARSRRCRIIPDDDGAASAVGEVLPELKGKLDGFAMRVPTPNVSLVDLNAVLDKKTTGEEVNAALRDAAAGRSRASSRCRMPSLSQFDFRGNPYSSIVDAPYTKVMDGDFLKVLSWYDNEWGYAAAASICCDRSRHGGCSAPSSMANALFATSTLKGRRVFVRVDFNVPLKNGLHRRRHAHSAHPLPTIQYALDAPRRVVLASHLSAGRRAKPNPGDEPQAGCGATGGGAGAPVAFAEDVRRTRERKRVRPRPDGGVVLLENLRFHPKRKRTTPSSRKGLAALADVYVNDAFGAAHRAHASVEAMVRLIAEKRAPPPDGEGAALPGRCARRTRAAVRRGCSAARRSPTRSK
jgi:glyceraldehyde 3-phosphate dehydrogenase